MNILIQFRTGIAVSGLACVLVLAGCSQDGVKGHGAGAPHDEGGADPISAAAMANYIAIQETLAADSVDGIGDHAGKLAGEFSTAGETAAAAAARSIAQTDDIEEARRHFETVSMALLAHLKAQGSDEGDFYEAYCPMAFGNRGASWVQTDITVNNPYYGSRMLRCGEIRETFAAAEAPGGEHHP